MEKEAIGTTADFWGLPQYGTPALQTASKVLAEYIFIADPVIGELQSQTVVLEAGAHGFAAAALPCLEMQTDRGEVYLTPRSIYADPLRGGDHILVLCDAHVPPQLGAGDLGPRPHAANTRAAAAEVAAAAAPAGPVFTAEQEYSTLDPFTGLPPGVFVPCVPIYAPRAAGCACACAGGGGGSLRSCESASPWGSPPFGGVGLTSDSPCSAASAGGLAASLAPPPCGGGCGGAAAATARLLLAAGGPPAPPAGSPAARRARQLAELHMRACIKAGLRYAGGAAACHPAAAVATGRGGCGCWGYRIGPCGGALELGDQLWVSRYLLRRLCDDLGVPVCLGRRGGCGAGGLALEFSTAASRAAPGGVCEVQQLISRLQAAHPRHAPGLGGAPPPGRAKLPPPPPPPFSVAVGDRRAAIVIPTSTLLARAGPFADRRAPADADPYLAAALLAAGALGLPLPPAAAAALAARAGAAPRADCAVSAAAALLARRRPAPPGASSHGTVSAPLRRGGAPPELGASEDGDDASEGGDSEDMLVSEIRRIDRAARRGGGGGRLGESEEVDEDLEDVSEDEADSAPPHGACGGAAAAAGGGDAEMAVAASAPAAASPLHARRAWTGARA
ncbi:MAG: hypothetical protein J3K34DRAFT_484695 [Monoraphidium minutum]|nr:MAG: hypothetical protein J3K34DRAFT_484695 [Monoraphidium minutum]